MRNRSSERTGAPPNVFDNSEASGAAMNSSTARQPTLGPLQVPLPQSPKPPPDTLVSDTQGDFGSRSHAAKVDPAPSYHDAGADSDTNMFDAESSSGDDYGPGGPPKDNLLSKLPNMFRLLDLYQEIGSGGLVEKMIIDQHSLHCLLNKMSSGSYELPWKINFKHLDQLAIKPIGVYGCKPEIVKFLRGVDCLDEGTEAILSATATSVSGLRSGLYIVLPCASVGQDSPTRSAYVVYWPEDTTWEDKAISSVRRNRVTFMRYLSKLTDQTIALVSTQQAEAIVWQAGARNKDAPVGAAESTDESRMNFFEVATFDESEEDVIALPGFTIHPESRDIPRINDALRVELVSGEEKAGLMVSTYEPASHSKDKFDKTMNPMALRSMIESKRWPCVLWSKILPDQLLVLGEYGLRTVYPKQFFEYDERMNAEKRARDHDHKEEIKGIESQINEDKPLLRAFLTRTIQNLFYEIYPSVYGEASQETDPTKDALLCEQYPDLKYASNEIKSKYNLAVVGDDTFKNLKQAWCITRDYLSSGPTPSKSSQKEFVCKVLTGLEENSSKGKATTKGKGFWRTVMDLIPGLPKSYNENQAPKDPEFIAALDTLLQAYPTVSELTSRITNSIQAYHATLGRSIVKDSMGRITKRERDRRLDVSGQLHAERIRSQSYATLLTLHEQLKAAMPSSADVSQATRIDSIEPEARFAWGKGFRVCGMEIRKLEPQTRVSIFPLELTEHDIQQCRSNESHIPNPKIGSKQRFEFALPEGHTVEFLQLVQDKCLVITSEPEKYHIYLENSIHIRHAVSNRTSKRQLAHDRLGGKPVFAFDQSTRLLAVLHGSEDPQLITYSFDEQFSTLASRGSALALKEWYDTQVHIEKICFLSGSEEICLIDSSGLARILSLVTRHFRPASLTITGQIVDVFSAPDGSCIFVSVTIDEPAPSRHKLLAFHTASFGSNEDGISPAILPPSDVRRVVTSFEGRNRIHVLSFSTERKTMASTALQVKQKVTEFSFRSNNSQSASTTTETINNCLLDCHMEVWTRFPVIPAVLRSTLMLSHGRESRKLIFASQGKLDEADSYFARMITKFEQTTRKPMDGSLSMISVTASPASPQALIQDFACSRFLLGSFVVELLCLIPLHLAITRDNRFIPLKDGVWDPVHESSLLGADVPTIIERLSLGWYESLFQSYMATKPVRVVSSMGEQSVGKSYCLNHFADTSFAGSAMRTTEGVWLSCTPTEDYLLVSLDFEGVHSIERSAQEDALLVLFNTAISNLVLFRNNFALSRDIAGLFTSFQSSAMVLDPQANPGLFNSTLAIIIKDVTDSDSKDIVKEFSLKFQRIVQREQQQNFISRLHRGRIQIIPWPVINSPSFYTLFHHLRRYLDKQPVTHPAGGVFLHNLKTLMAKIKASDWGSLDQNLATHRVLQLTERLQDALSRGRAEQGIDSWGPLKNLDTDEDLPSMELDVVFFVPDVSGNGGLEDESTIVQLLRDLVAHYNPSIGSRHALGDAEYVDRLQQQLFQVLDRRLEHVRYWIEKNVQRFPATNQDIRNIHGKFDNLALVMRTAVRLCLSTCAECHFQCILPSRHTGPHDCTTGHRCEHLCEVAEDHASPVSCGLLAGHSARHMCDIRAHSCGHDCHLRDKAGCAGSCVQPLDHEGEHLCSARSHLCGQPCSLVDAGSGYHCPGTCHIPWDEPHKRHSCDNSQSCPLECQLCRRLCCEPDHFHGLDKSAVHLCGQKHDCPNPCAANGICRIETQPSAIEQQFSGRHQAFQYTRYSQVQQRLTCVIPIPPGELQHPGPHAHSTDPNAFHFCDARCPDCRYFCTLPLGHTQQLHETSHGSMTSTQWVLEGTNPNAVYELRGRKFGSGDEGAPLLCHLLCADQGRHAHIDYCRDIGNCNGPEQQHIRERMRPNANQPKDWITHRLKWARSGFKDPYSRDQQVDFAKCDVLCPGSEHEAQNNSPAHPSYCNLAIFHAPHPHPSTRGSNSYVSRDGHSFDCPDPSRMNQAYHVVFVIDSSGSMCSGDRQPLANTPISARLRSTCNNRYGAVLSALYGFWHSREPAQSGSRARQDAYSVVTFDYTPVTRVSNDFTSTTDQLIGQLIPQRGCGGTDFNAALTHAQALIRANWSSDRAPVLVFLSDGMCTLRDNSVHDLCRMCIQLGKPLALYTVSFGPETYSASLRQMANIAQSIYASAPQDAFIAARGNPCSYSNALDSVQLANTFLGIANSLQKPRASLIGQLSGRVATV